MAISFLAVGAMSPSFSLSGVGAPDFHMNSETGVITTKEKLDREDKAEFYNLVAYAEDRESGEACRVDIRIRVLDENDHAPKFTERGQYVVTVKEDAPVGALIGKVHADDEDLGLNRKVRYALLSVMGGGSSLGASSSQQQEAGMIDDQFGMDTTSGVISLLRPLDRELVSQYNLTIQVCYVTTKLIFFPGRRKIREKVFPFSFARAFNNMLGSDFDL